MEEKKKNGKKFKGREDILLSDSSKNFLLYKVYLKLTSLLPECIW